jgi:hypothetical protein
MCTSAQSQSMPACATAECAASRHVGEERVGEPAALTGEPVGAARHPVPDRQVALLLADREQRVGQLDRPLGRERVISGSCVR